MKNKKQIWNAGAVLLAASMMLSGCGVIETLTSAGKGEREYGKAETMVILSTERLRYEEMYTEELWNAAADDHGTTFETILLSQVHDFMIELKTMSHMAEDQKIELTSREKDLVKEASSQYFDALGNHYAAEFGLTEEDVNALYTDYWTAEKLVEQLTGSMNLEVSDSEAKVIKVAQIETSSPETAGELLAKISEEEADFYTIAKEYSENEKLEKLLYYGLMDEEYEKAAYGLETGEVSGIVEDSGKYYILMCINDYDEDATRIRKEEMIQEKKSEAFHSSYQVYKTENPLVEDTALWDSLELEQCPLVNADFFEIYERVCMSGTETKE